MKNCGLYGQTLKTDMNYNPYISGVKKIMKNAVNRKELTNFILNLQS